MEEGAVARDSKHSPATITVNVKFDGRVIPLTLSADSTVKNLKKLLQPLTNVLPRGQKLISKGKLLADEMTLRALEVGNCAKIMLMASRGLHQGDVNRTPTASVSKTIPATVKRQVGVSKSRLDLWKATRIIGLSRSNLKVIPDEVWACEIFVRVLDISENSIRDIPSKISTLTSLHKLHLNANDIVDESMSWEGVASLKSLEFLSMSQNHLTALPSALGSVTSLTQLHIANNKLTSLPLEIRHLSNLQVLKANNNRLRIIPACIGDCTSLTEIDLSSNLLSQLPETIGNLQNLKALYLGNNGLTSLPSQILKLCARLSTLDLHNTEITVDLLRQLDGWNDFDERRRLKHQKQLDFRVMNSSEFDEGADKY